MDLLAVSPPVILLINRAIDCHHFSDPFVNELLA